MGLAARLRPRRFKPASFRLRGADEAGVDFCRDYVEADDYAVVVDAVDQSDADSVGIVNRGPGPASVFETVHQVCGVGVGAHDCAFIVDAERLRGSALREVELGEGSGSELPSVLNAVAIEQEADDRLRVVDPGGLRTRGSGKVQFLEHRSARQGVNVGVEVAEGILVVARSLEFVVETEKLVESGAREIDGGELAGDIGEAVRVAGRIDVEAVSGVGVVDADDLGLRRLGVILGHKGAGQRKREAVVGVGAVVAGDEVGFVDAEQLDELIGGVFDVLEGEG